MSNGITILAQLVDLLPGGILGLLIFYGPLAAGTLWALSAFVRSRTSGGEIIGIVVFWVVLLAFYVPLYVAEHRVLKEERERQRDWQEQHSAD